MKGLILKATTSLVLVLIFVNFLSAQTFEWAKRMGAGNTDEGYNIATDGSGNVYTIGTFRGTVDFDPGAGSFFMTSTSNTFDIFIQKLDANGNFVWAKRMGGTGVDYGYGIGIDAAGNVYTTGFFQNTVDFDPGAGVFNLASAGQDDIFVQKLDANGNFVWAKRMGGAGADYGIQLTVDATGNVYTVGYFSGTVDFDPNAGVLNLTSSGGSDVFVQKLNTIGDLQWAHRFGSTQADEGYAIQLDATGNVYVTGTFRGTVDFDPGAGVSNLTSSGAEDIFVLKLDNNGNHIWSRCVGGSGYDWGSSLTVDASNNVYVSGSFTATVDFDPGAGTFNLTTTGNDDIFFLKLDGNGDFVWANKIGSTANEYVNYLKIGPSGDLYAIGEFSANNLDFNPGAGTFLLSSFGSLDAFVLRLTNNGDFVWAFQMGGTGADVGYALQVDASENVYSTGYFSGTADFAPGNYTFTMTTDGGRDIFVQKTGPCIPTASSMNVAECATYTSPSGNYTYSNSGIYTDTIANAAGCDSVITINLTINQPTASNIAITACVSHTENGQTYTSTGIYTQTIQNMAGCDSTITLDITINQPSSSTLTEIVCDSYTLNGQTYASSGVYTQTLQNTAGCDSIITLNLTVNQPTVSSITEVACDSYTLNGQTYSATGIYTQVITNTAGCDSTITLDLTINHSTTNTLTEVACTSYTLNGQTYTNSGMYTQTLQNTAGCDSTITLDLTINTNTINLNVTVSGVTLTADQNGALYQWFDCTSQTIITSETAQSFMPLANGSYAVIINFSGCIDTTDCVDVTTVGLSTLNTINTVKLYPNPAQEILNISSNVSLANTQIRIINSMGQLVSIYENTYGNTISLEISSLKAGVYYIEIEHSGKLERLRWIKS
ncbi:MAG: SBBP repeat-containing protein [Flavobacteriales bacterium]